MKFLLFFLPFSLLSLSMCQFGIDYSKVSRTFYSYGKSVAEVSVINFSESGERIPPYFDKARLMKKTESYLLSSMPDASFSYSFVFYPNEYATNISSFSFRLKKELPFLFSFNKEAKYTITKGGNEK